MSDATNDIEDREIMGSWKDKLPEVRNNNIVKDFIKQKLNEFDEDILYPDGIENGRYLCMSIEEERKLKRFIITTIRDTEKEEREKLKKILQKGFTPDIEEAIFEELNKENNL